MTELLPFQLCGLSNRKVYVKSDIIDDINGKEMVCDGSRKIDGVNYIILDNEPYSYIWFIEDEIKVFID